MPFKKLLKAPITKSLGADINNTLSQSNKTSKLLWFECKLNKQIFDMLLDCGASTCCIANRCVTSSDVLKKLPKHPYQGPGLVDVNGNSLHAEHVIRLDFVVGEPELSLAVDFVIVKDLPYSCIVGMNMLNILKTWGVNNNSRTLHLNSSIV